MNRLERALLKFKSEGKTLTHMLCWIARHLDQEFGNIAWNTLNIDYHPPKVERLWAQIDTMRLMIHRIHPTKEAKNALFHPHPWPSAVLILSGEYEMGIGYSQTSEPPPIAATVTLRKGSSYEMTDKNGWHYVSPKEKPSMSLMLIDSPWKEPHPFYTEGEKVRLNPLTEKAREKVISALKKALGSL